MSLYLDNIKLAIISFPFLAIALSFPILIVEYRRFGSFTLRRAFVIYAMVFYILTAYYMVILPLPSIETVAHLHTQKVQLVPLNIIRVFIHDSGFYLFEPVTWIRALKSSAFLQPAFNLLLTVPFGIFLRYYFRLTMKQTIIVSFGLSLFFELTQLSGLYFIYPRPYRLFDIDDLILNTSGGGLGFLLAPLLNKILPNRERMDQQSLQRGQQVSGLRRIVAWIIDYLIIARLIHALLLLIFKIMSLNSPTHNPLINYILPVGITLVLIPFLTNGVTIGKLIVRIKIVTNHNLRNTRWHILTRQSLLYFMILPIINGFNSQLSKVLVDYSARTELNFIILGILTSFCVFFTADFLITALTSRQRLFYDHLAHTTQISTIRKG